VKRLLKLVTILFVSTTVLMPLLECFDRWDKPGLTNDTEFPVFLVTLFISLVLLAVLAIARRAIEQQESQIRTAVVYEILWREFTTWMDLPVSPLVSPPLRI
jgi:uncharacterized protein YacL